MKLVSKFTPFLLLILLFASCEHGPEFVHEEPISLKSWLDYSDSNYCPGLFSFNNSTSPVVVRSNFEVLSDTQWSFIIRVPKVVKNNVKGIDYIGFKIMNSQIGKFLNDGDFTTKIVQTVKGQFNSVQTKIVTKNFKLIHKGDDFFEMNGDMKILTESPDAALDSFEMSFANIAVEKSFIRVWVNGAVASPSGWDIDLKAGNEYNPEPTMVVTPELGKMIQIGLALVDGKKKYEISPTEKQFTNLINGSQKWTASSGYFLVDKFYYKDILKAKFRIEYQSPDKTKTYSVDSVKINYSRISF